MGGRAVTGTWSLGDATIVWTRIGPPATVTPTSAPSTAAVPTYVLIHGIGMGRSALQPLAEALAASATVYAIDLPGFGDSPEPPEALSIAATADIVARFLTDTGIADPVLVGHSMGSQVVAEILARHPELASRAVLIGPTVDPAARSARQQAGRLLRDLLDEGPRLIGIGMVEYFKAGPRWFVGKLRATLAHRMEDTLPAIRARVLVMRGDEDLVSPHAWAAHMTELMADARLVEIPDRGHEAMIRSAEPAASLIADFVAEDELH